MPNKTIYVSEDDLAIFERAQELTGSNLSSAIVRALRQLIEVEEGRQRGFDQITVIVGTDGAHRHKRFRGYRLVRWLQPSPNGDGTEVLNVYRTAGNRFALHSRVVADWPFSGGDPEYYGDPKHWDVGNGLLKRLATWGYDWDRIKEAGTYTLQVFDTLEELKPRISKELYTLVSQAMEGPQTEELDI